MCQKGGIGSMHGVLLYWNLSGSETDHKAEERFRAGLPWD